MSTVRERLNRLKEIGEDQDRYLQSLQEEKQTAKTHTKKSAGDLASRITQEAKAQAVSQGIELPRASTSPLAGVTVLPSSPQQAARDFAYSSERIGAGLLGAAEGVSDFLGAGFGKAVQGITSLGGLAPNPVSEWGGRVAEHYLTTSPTQEYEENIRQRYNPTRGAETVTGVEQTIAQMLPGIGAARAVSATGNALNAAQAAQRGANAGRAIFGLQAAGQSAQQAKQEGATTNQALAYGAASGLLESAIEGIAGGIPALGSGRLNEAVSAVTRNPVLNRAADIAGEGAEEALSTAVTPYLQRAMYNPDAENATPRKILQSAALGSLAAGVLQGGLELPGAVSRTVSDIRDVRQAVGSNQDIINRANQRIAQDMQARREAVNPLMTMLPTAEEVQNRQPGSPIYQLAMRAELPAVDRQPQAGYDGGTQNRQVGGVTYGRREPAASQLRGVYEADVRNGDPRTYTGGKRTSSQIDARESQATAEWVDGHLVENPTPAAGRALSSARQYAPDVFAVDDAAIKSRNRSAWALTSDGKIYISDAVPENLADVVGYHESVHSLKQRGSQQYDDFVSQIGERLNYGEYADRVLGIILQSRLKGKSILDLTVDELDTAYDELNAVVWGYYKADPENARAQFSGVFQDYDAYIRELDGIMEGSASSQKGISGAIPLELPRAVPVDPAQGVDPESSVGAAPAGFDPWSHFQASSTEFFPEGANAARDVDVPTTDPQGRRIRKTAATAMGAKAIPDEAISDIQNMVLRGELSYNRVSDKSSIDRAIKTIQDKGYQGALEEFRNSVSKGVVSKDIATLGQQLLINAANAGDGKTTAELLTLYAQMETTAGQAVQAASNLGYQLQDCCCQTQRAVDGVNYNMATQAAGIQNTIQGVRYDMSTQACDTRNTIQTSTRDIIDNANANSRAILDFLTQDKIATLQAENQSLKLAASQSNQNAVLMAAMDANQAELIRRLGRDCPVPAYVVPNPNCCYTPCGTCG